MRVGQSSIFSIYASLVGRPSRARHYAPQHTDLTTDATFRLVCFYDYKELVCNIFVDSIIGNGIYRILFGFNFLLCCTALDGQGMLLDVEIP
jgi:hypothetical protein